MGGGIIAALIKRTIKQGPTYNFLYRQIDHESEYGFEIYQNARFGQ